MAERCPVQTSAVFLLGQTQFQAAPPPSPPSPIANFDGNSINYEPLEEISLDVPHENAPPAPSIREPERSKSSHSSSPFLATTAVTSISPPGTAPASLPRSTAQSPLLLPSLSRQLLAPQPTSMSSRIAGAVHVLATEAAALENVSRLYATSPSAQDGFDRAVDAIVHTQTAYPPGKLIIIGVGKSGHIGRKLAATFNSLAVPASFLHPTEALHGDLGHIRAHDALLFITYSGKTQELAILLPHLHPSLPLIILTGHITRETCELAQHRHDDHHRQQTPAVSSDGPIIILPAPLPEEERVSFGVAAPTASTTTALAVGDALAIVASKDLHPENVSSVFSRNHPGGAIGEALRRPTVAPPEGDKKVWHGAVSWQDIPVLEITSVTTPTCADVLRAGYNSSNGWVRLIAYTGCGIRDSVAPPSKIRRLNTSDLNKPVQAVEGLVISQESFTMLSTDEKERFEEEYFCDTPIRTGQYPQENNTIIALTEKGHIVAVIEHESTHT